MATTDLLTKKLHQLTSQDVRNLRQIADEVFEPLTRPFRQTRSESIFSFRKTMREAARQGGDFMPVYEPHSREHRKSRLVIAMSLSGIDRCAAVGLIPLFNELQKFLDFKLLIYTDDIIPAKFSRDGFLENDIDLAWNNVAAPVIFNRLADMQFDRKEDTLLLIDNFGGGDSAWFTHWSEEHRTQVQEEQSQYYAKHDKFHAFWGKLRTELAGDYDKIHTSRYAKSLKNWQTIIDRNIKERWVDAPAMMDYLVRWLFHPEFGRTSHSKYRFSTYGINVSPAMRRLKGKFKTVHWLRTIAHDESQYLQNQMLQNNVIDYMHAADTIEGFAVVLSNIVHGRCTNKLSKDIIKFADLINEPIGEDPDGEDKVDHTETMVGKEACFKNVIHPTNHLPQNLTWDTSHYVKSTKVRKENQTAWSNVDVSEWFPSDLDGLTPDWTGFMTSITPQFRVTPAMSQFSLLEEANRVIREIKTTKIIPSTYGYNLEVVARTGQVVESPNYNRHKTKQLEPIVNEYLELWSEDYTPYTTHLPLTNVIWCTGAVSDPTTLSYAVAYEGGDWKGDVYHEHGHHFEHIIPEIGLFTNYLIQRKVGLTKTGCLDKSKLIPVFGGSAMPVADGSKPWITSYAGKWYDRPHKNLPIATEIISVHSEYFQSPEALIPLMAHDPFLVKFMCFVFMGGPVAAMKASQQAKNREADDAALEALQQKSPEYNNYTTKSSRRSAGRSSWAKSTGRAKKNRSKSFGV